MIKKYKEDYYIIDIGGYVIRKFKSKQIAEDWIEYTWKNGHNFTSLHKMEGYKIVNRKIIEEDIEKLLSEY